MSLAYVVTVVAGDRFLNVRLLVRKDHWIFLSVMSGFMVLTRGYLTSRRVGPSGEAFFMNLMLGTIPMEFFSYGFSLVSLRSLSGNTSNGKGKERGKNEHPF